MPIKNVLLLPFFLKDPVVMTGVKAGTRYDAAAEKVEVNENQIAIDEEKEVDEITMKVFGEIANSVDPSIDIEIDYPSKYPDKMMPILDMKMATNNQNQVVHCFYRKPQTPIKQAHNDGKIGSPRPS